MKKTLSIIIVIILSTIASFSQDVQSKGKDFWLTFLPNYHNNAFSTDLRQRNGDSLYIFITSDVPTSGLIEYIDNKGIGYSQNFIITNPKEMYIFKISHWGFELEGFNNSGEIDDKLNYSCEKVCEQSFRITSDNEVTVYAHNQANTTSDAFLVLPVGALGKTHYVMSYNSDGKYITPGIISSSTPSQFAIVATENNTLVNIKPSAPTRINKSATQKVTLNKGEVYLVQADITQDNLTGDLTGTEVISDKNIAVFAGHQRSRIPVKTNHSSASRDMLIEQIPNLTTWGKNYFIAPYTQMPEATPKGSDLYRVLSANDSTNVYVDKVLKATLKKGEFYEDSLKKASEVTSNNPILVAQFKKTAQDAAGNFPNSDPFMMILPPKEQFMDSYRFINVQSHEFNGQTYNQVYNFQYILIIAPDSITGNINFDGTTINKTFFSKIIGTDYSYANIRSNDGVHEIKSSGPFGLMVYGYGEANSYGYIGGMSFKKITFDAPQFTLNTKCDSISGEVKVEQDKDIQLIDLELKNNVNVNFSKTDVSDKLKQFKIKLIDRRKDGSIEIIAKDSKGRTETKKVEIPGFTLGFVNNGTPVSTYNLSVTVPLNTDNQFIIPIRNYGKFTQKITTLKRKLNDPKLKVSYIVLRDIKPAPASDDTLIIKFNTSLNEVYEDEISLLNDCGDEITIKVQFITSKCGKNAFEYKDFTSDAKIFKTGYTYRDGNRLRLTSTNQNLRGAFWRAEKLSVGKSFSTEFKFNFSSGSNNSCTDNSTPGADGIAFVIQNSTINALGLNGGGIGYESIENAIAIEFDTFNNDSTQIENYFDPNGNHIALVKSINYGKISPKHEKDNTIKLVSSIPQILLDKDYFCKIDYNSDAMRIEVYLDDKGTFASPILVADNFDISKILKLDDDTYGYLGFTSATGCATEYHDILSWSFCGTSAPISDINEKNSDENIKISELNEELKICCFENNEIYSASIFDLNGRQIKSFSNIDNSFELILPIDFLLNGTYFIEIRTQKEIIRKVFLKK
jgi:hypothetical protein